MSSELSVADALLSLINIQIPSSCDSDLFLATLWIRDNWKVVVFYDCGGFDYIDCFISPEGKKIDFWDWPDSVDRQKLVQWAPPRG